MDDYLSSDAAWRGRFWLPDRPENVQRGNLTYTPDKGVRLALIGGFDDAEWLPTKNGSTRVLSARTRRWPVIYGAVGNKPVTLLECAAVSSKSYLFATQVEEQELRASRALLGIHLTGADNPCFSATSVQIENLTEWDHRADIAFEIAYPESSPRNSRWDIKVDPVEHRSVRVGDIEIELHRNYRLPSHDIRRSRLEASTYAVSAFTLRSAQPRSLATWAETVQILQDLITLAMDTPCAILTETVLPSDEVKADAKSAARDRVDIYAQHTVTGNPDTAGVEGADALFTLGVEGVSYETLIPEWFAVQKRFEVACDMILSLIYQSDGYIQPQLITAVAAAEAFHQALELPPPIEDSEFKTLKKLLKAAIPADRHRWLSEKLGRNSHTLRQRLIDLASRPDEDVMTALLPNIEEWADAAKNARNLVAHGGPTGSDVVLMYTITEVTIAVVIVNLMHELGIPAKRLTEMIMTSGRLERAGRLARDRWPATGSE